MASYEDQRRSSAIMTPGSVVGQSHHVVNIHKVLAASAITPVFGLVLPSKLFPVNLS